MLEIKDLSFCLGRCFLLHPLSLSFIQGEIVGILGPNGSGKSTFLKTLAGIWEATSGEVLWKKERLHLKERKAVSRIISLVPQLSHTFFEFTVEEFVEMGLYAHSKLGSREKRILTDWALKITDVWSFRFHKITELSVGERQRVTIARSLVTKSPILLLDEPIASLDIRHQIEVVDILQDLKAEGKVILVSLHDLNLAERMCDRALVLNHGKCVDMGKVSEVLNPQLLFEVFGIAEESLKKRWIISS